MPRWCIPCSSYIIFPPWAGRDGILTLYFCLSLYTVSGLLFLLFSAVFCHLLNKVFKSKKYICVLWTQGVQKQKGHHRMFLVYKFSDFLPNLEFWELYLKNHSSFCLALFCPIFKNITRRFWCHWRGSDFLECYYWSAYNYYDNIKKWFQINHNNDSKYRNFQSKCH